MSGEHMLVRSDPESPGFNIVEPGSYETVGRVYWSDGSLYMSLHPDTDEEESVRIIGPMRVQKACGWLNSLGRGLTEYHGFTLSGYIIACEQQAVTA